MRPEKYSLLTKTEARDGYPLTDRTFLLLMNRPLILLKTFKNMFRPLPSLMAML
jgi:hypothetical protein